MKTATIPAAMEASTSVATAARVHASAAASPVSAAMLRKRWQRKQDQQDGSAEKGLERGGLVHGTTPPVNQGCLGYRKGNPM
jgi:hypothetical protein